MAQPTAMEVEEQTFLSEPIYDIKSKTGDINVEKFAEDDEKKEDKIIKVTESYPSGSQVTDLSAMDNQMQNLTKYDATMGELYIDNFNIAADIYKDITTDLQNRRFDTTRAKSQSYTPNNTTKHFSNVSEQNNNPFYKDVGAKALGATTELADIYGKPFGGGPTGAFVTGMMSTIMGGGFPLATAAAWIGYGLAQERDQNNFVKLLSGGSNEMTNLLGSDQTWEYTARPNMNAKQYMNHILYNSNNPGYRLKKYAQYGDTPNEALSQFIQNGVQNDVFSSNSIMKMASTYNDVKPGSNDYFRAKASQDALRDMDWKISGNIMIDPSGQQYVHGKKWTPGDGKTDFSSMFKEPKVTTKEPKVIKTEPAVTKAEPTGGGWEQGQREEQMQRQQVQKEREKYKDTATTGAKAGYTYGLQAGGPVPIGNPMEQQQQQPIQDAGNLELVQEQGKDQSGVADDVKRPLNEGDFVVNAPAMEMAGHGDIERMVTKAIVELQRKGVKLDFGQAAEDTDSIVQALVSNNEMIIPKIIAEQIGYDRLEKINNRGKQRVDEIEKERAEQEKGFVQQNPQGQSPQPVQTGGIVTLEENKNQPIAVPRESFATMSSVGKRLLSPLAPEQQDREKELTELSKPSQSFEGFMKPIKMADGSIVQTRADKNNNPFNLASNDKTDIFYGSIGRDIENLSDEMPEKGFLKFDTLDNGLRAGAYVLRNQYNNMNADEIANGWSKTDKVSYAQAIKNKFENDKINTQDDGQLLELLKIVINQEGTKQVFSEEQLINAVEQSNKEKENSTWAKPIIKPIIKQKPPIPNNMMSTKQT
jgi:hypothetical protein